jgi:hypothetical protein
MILLAQSIACYPGKNNVCASFAPSTMPNEIDESNVSKAVAAEINLGETTLDVYMLPSGEKRVGLESTGDALGFSTKGFFQRTKRQSKSLKALQGMGFTNKQMWVNIIGQQANQRLQPIARTIGIPDFTKLITYEAILKRNLKAIILLAAFAEAGIERTIEDVFAGRSIDFILEKIVHYSKWTYEEFEQALAENREDVRSLYGWGLPPSSR